MQAIQQIIDEAWENRSSLQPGTAPAAIGEAVASVLDQLDQGALRVAEKIDGEWVTHQWLKKAVLLSFRLQDNSLIDGGAMRYFDKVPNKFAELRQRKIRARRLPRRATGNRPSRLPSSARTWC
jgi:2,3,4,5-tetrahydropyridine-2-carboxylate N-succinyltransferase